MCLRGVAIRSVLLAATAGAIGLLYAWWHRQSDPLSQASRAYDKGQWATAAGLAREVLNSRKDDSTALRLLARSSARLGRDDAAIAIYTGRLGENAIEAEDYLLLGLAHQGRGQVDAAARAWNKVLDAPRLSPRLVEELARLQLQGHRSDDAIRVAEHLSRQAGWEARGSMMLGTIRAALKDVSGAALSFRRAMELDPSEIDKSGDPTHLRKLIGRTFLRMHQPAEARELLTAILDRGPDAEAAWLLSRSFLQEGNKKSAQEQLTHSGSYRALNLLEPEPGAYVGEAQCAKCHAAIFRESLASRHTQSYYRGRQLDDLPLPDRPLPDPDDSSVIHTFERRKGVLHEQTRVGSRAFDAVIEYAFGTKDRYLTMVSRDSEGGYRIARLSYYDTPKGNGWDRSVLDVTYPSRDRADDFQGQPIGVRDGLARCLYCHLTNPRTGREPTGPETSDRAIGCERCHGPGGNHIAAVEAGVTDSAIINPAAASPSAVTTRQCNDCHILDPNFRDANPDAPGLVRSQGAGWSLSRCNTESDGAFGCVTCHDPHKSARAVSTAQYETKCLTCHSASVTTPSNAKAGPTPGPHAAGLGRPCPVDARAGCVACHMPQVRIDSLHTKLTDHFIRLRRPAR